MPRLYVINLYVPSNKYCNVQEAHQHEQPPFEPMLLAAAFA
jgi:hypothetical protein